MSSTIEKGVTLLLTFIISSTSKNTCVSYETLSNEKSSLSITILEKSNITADFHVQELNFTDFIPPQVHASCNLNIMYIFPNKGSYIAIFQFIDINDDIISLQLPILVVDDSFNHEDMDNHILSPEENIDNSNYLISKLVYLNSAPSPNTDQLNILQSDYTKECKYFFFSIDKIADDELNVNNKNISIDFLIIGGHQNSNYIKKGSKTMYNELKETTNCEKSKMMNTCPQPKNNPSFKDKVFHVLSFKRPNYKGNYLILGKITKSSSPSSVGFFQIHFNM